MMEMTEQEIREYYDASPELTLFELSRISGRTIAELRRILTV